MPFEWVKEIVPAPEMVEGPFYGHGGPERSDIREGLPGRTLELLIKLVDVESGEALSGMKVDLWHCDAQGRYSGYESNPDEQPQNVDYQLPMNGDSFLRGAQITDGEGLVRFLTILPGWYTTRTPHLHFKVFDGETCILTSQLYLPEAALETVYLEDAAYSRKVDRDTFNQTDSVLASTSVSIDGCWVELSEVGGTLRGESLLGIDRDARSVRREIPPGFRPPVGGVRHGKSVR